MEFLLAGVALGSLVLATAMAAVAWKVMRDHRRFAAARIDALAALAAGGGLVEPPFAEAPDEPVIPAALPVEASPPPVVPPAVAARPHRTRRGRLALGAGLTLAALGGLAAAVGPLRPSVASALTAVVRAASAAEPPTGAAPLELRTLESRDDAGTFVVSGVVANPPGGQPFDHLAAVVYLFDRDGVCFANGRASIEADTLRPGADSAFEVRLPAASPVSRYRIGFRLADGAAIAHVDRRAGANGS